jgi:hypothetical protein
MFYKRAHRQPIGVRDSVPWMDLKSLFATENGTERSHTHDKWGRGQVGMKGARGSRKDQEVCGNKLLPK